MNFPDGVNNNSNKINQSKLYYEYLDNLDGKADNQLFGQSIFDSPDIEKCIQEYHNKYDKLKESLKNSHPKATEKLNFLNYLKGRVLKGKNIENVKNAQENLKTEELAQILKETTPIDTMEKAENFVKILLQVKPKEYFKIISENSDNIEDDFIIKNIETCDFFDEKTKKDLLEFANYSKNNAKSSIINRLVSLNYTTGIKQFLGFSKAEIFDKKLSELVKLDNSIEDCLTRDGEYTPDVSKQTEGTCLTCAGFNSLAYLDWGDEYLDKIFDKSGDGIIKIPALDLEIKVNKKEIEERLDNSAIGDGDLTAFFVAINKPEAENLAYGVKANYKGTNGANITDIARLFYQPKEAYDRSFIIDGNSTCNMYSEKFKSLAYRNENYNAISDMKTKNKYNEILEIFNNNEKKVLMVAINEKHRAGNAEGPHALAIKNIDKKGVTLVDSNNPGSDLFVPKDAFFNIYYIQGIEFD